MTEKMQSHSESGFVLVLALGAVLVLTLIVATVASNVQGLVEVAINVKKQEQLSWDRTTSRSRVLYSILTGHNTFHGFSNITIQPRVDEMGDLVHTPLPSDLRVDGRWYLMGGRPFAVQDKSGLLNANTLSTREFEQLFSNQLVPGISSQSLSHQYQDFTDVDDNKKLLGAESNEYLRQNSDGPLNRSVFLPKELEALLAWPTAFFPWDSTHADQLLWNMNLAPRSVLSIKTSSNFDDIDRYVKEREDSFFIGVSSVEEVLGTGSTSQDELSITSVVSKSFRLAFIDRKVCDNKEDCDFSLYKLIELGDIRIELVDFTVTPSSDIAPFRIDNVTNTSLFSYLLSRELKFPLSSEAVDALLSTYLQKNVSIPAQIGESMAFDNKLLVNDLLKIEDVPITEYENKTISVR